MKNKNSKLTFLLLFLLLSNRNMLFAQGAPNTYITIGLGGKHTLDNFNDPAKLLRTTGLGIDFDFVCRCSNASFHIGILQEINKKYAVEFDYTQHYKFLNLSTEKLFLIESYGDRDYKAEKTSIKLYRTWHLNKHWQGNIGLGYRILWNKVFQRIDRPPFPSTTKEATLLQEKPLAEELIAQGYQQLSYSSITKFNDYSRHHLLTASTALEYKLSNNITFFAEGALDRGFRRISTTNIAYSINEGEIHQAEIWDKGNVFYFYLPSNRAIFFINSRDSAIGKNI